MSQIEKLIEKLKNAKGEASARDIENLLRHMGFVKDRQRGSHVLFCREGMMVGFPVHDGMVKIGYIKMIFQRLEI
ncbi:MAG: type II toxin-antitoxin system HicA family toxin [Methylococcaceae bacterium]